MDMDRALLLVALLCATQTGLTLARVVARWTGVRESNDVQPPPDPYTDHLPGPSDGATSTEGRVSMAPHHHDHPA